MEGPPALLTAQGEELCHEEERSKARAEKESLNIHSGEAIQRSHYIDHLEKARECIKEAIRRYGVDGLAISFNGGKDCTVMLDLISQAAATSTPKHTWPACYAAHGQTFGEVEEFISDCQQRYNLKISRYNQSIKTALGCFLDENKSIRAVFVGIRRSDPYCADLDYFSPTDKDWPATVRIHPIVDWTYDDVWTYLRGEPSPIPYCPLYDHGYTSLGDASRTTPNPHLARLIDSGTAYLPAHMLADGIKYERAGRL